MQKKGTKYKDSSKGSIPVKDSFLKFLHFITNGINPYLIITLLIFGVYFPILSFGLTNLDDEKILHNANSLTIKSNPLESFSTDAMLSHQSDEFYRPMQGLSFIMDANLSNTDPFYFHLTNLLLHIINCCFLFYLMCLLNSKKIVPFFLTLIFSTHPLFNQAVIWLPSRGDLLVSLYSLISVIAFIKYSDFKNYTFFFINIFTFFLAVYSKEIALLLPVIFLSYYYLKVKNTRKLFTAGNISLIGIWFLIILTYLLMRHNIVKVILNPDQFGLNPFIHNLPVIPEFLSKFLIPFNLSVLPEYNIISIIIGIVVIISLLLYVIKFKNDNIIFLYIGWFIILTVTAMFYRHEHLEHGYDYLEHRSYLPLMGIIMLLASFRYNQKKLKFYVYPLIAILIIFTGITISRSSVFNNPETFYTSVINKGTQVALAYNNRGNYYYYIHKIKDAAQDFNRAIELKPDYANAYNNRGIIKNDLGDFKNAIVDYNLAIKFKNKYAEAFNNRGVSKYNSGDISGAKQDYDNAVKYNPDYAEAYNNIGVATSDLGDNISSLKYYSKAIELKSNYGEAYNNRGLAKIDLRDYNSGKDDFIRATEINPQNFFAFNNLGVCFNNLNEYAKAIPEFEKSIKINSRFAEAWKNLGISKYKINDKNGACFAWEKATELGNKDCRRFLDDYCQ